MTLYLSQHLLRHYLFRSTSLSRIVLAIYSWTDLIVCSGTGARVTAVIDRPASIQEFPKLLLESSMLTALSGHEQYVSLLQTVWVLMTCLDSPSLGQIILSRHLNDILAALLQLVHGKQTAVDKNKTSLPLSHL